MPRRQRRRPRRRPVMIPDKVRPHHHRLSLRSPTTRAPSAGPAWHSEIVLIVHWVGGAHSELRLPKRRRGQRNSTSADIIQAVRQLVLIASDDLIAGLLNRNGLKTGNGNRWTRERVTSMRSSYHLPVFKPADDRIEPWLNLSNAAKLLKISPKTLRLAAEAGEIEAFHPLSDGPWIFTRASLITTASQSIAQRARQNPRYPTGSHPNQQSLFSSTT